MTSLPLPAARVHRIRGRVLLAAAAAALVLALVAADRLGGAQTPSAFGARVEQLSEPGGYFDTDNLISNERSYLHPLDALRARGLEGGVYIGVGPDQNFAYIAEIRPAIAFLIDVRRDNLLLHLLFKALFAMSADRAEYLAGLFGRLPPGQGLAGMPEAPRTRDAAIQDLVRYIDARPPDPEFPARRGEIERHLARFGVPLAPEDLARIAGFHRRFITSGLSIRFQSTGRPPRPDYPTYRDLLLETDRGGRPGGFLASEAAFQQIKTLHAEDRIIPVVGDLAGPHAIAAIGAHMRERGERLTAFYTSNVELYLSQDGRYGRFVDNLASLPSGEGAVIIRSVFRARVPESVPGYLSASVVQPVADLVTGYAEGRLRSYWDVIQAR